MDLALSVRHPAYAAVVDDVLGKDAVMQLGRKLKEMADAGDRDAAVQVRRVVRPLEIDEDELA